MSTEGAQRATTQVVILGAGVIGLTVAHVLSKDARYKIKIVARDMPDDLDSQAFASPWAGANWSPMGEYNARIYKWEKTTFDKLWEMIPAGLAIASPSRVFYDAGADLDALWYKTLVRDFRILRKDELPDGTHAGVGFQTVSVWPQAYLPWLKSELEARDVEFVRKRVATLGEAAALAGPNGVLVNATGLGARSLIGLEDKDVYPIRGQTIVISNPNVREFMCTELTSAEDGNATYIIPRPAPGGWTTILGGKYQKDNWDTSFSAADAQGILDRCAALAPAIKDPETRILRHNVGLRPARRGGPRVEAEKLNLPLKNQWLVEELPEEKGAVLLVHAYGFGPAGYQMSWGAAEEVGHLVDSHINPNKA
ncbi:nucleotide-binding domain-containing protein [Trametes versicolor FP-101664 SS1]|uniref:nucleotide-binding domain-containing protein n=1 Tax=Trametes versicolor (strain FP-101664) TaxID=717944 RepID=UPI0004621438|nr:nucleotide-binding domain-containing protein [Trametes versicolor FP-101664 SS1]EIW64128.1 nucleotide-binding domain-containing protein [Trametes versicolor FP-101664 SS1]